MAVGFDPRSGRDFVISNNEGIGWGAGEHHDGANAQQHLSQSVVRNTPVEVLEQRAPLLHHRVALIPDSGGAGRYRGGLGVRARGRAASPGEVLSMKKKSKTKPWALGRARARARASCWLWPGTPAERRVGMHRPRWRRRPVRQRHRRRGRLGRPADPRPRPCGRPTCSTATSPATAASDCMASRSRARGRRRGPRQPTAWRNRSKDATRSRRGAEMGPNRSAATTTPPSRSV